MGLPLYRQRVVKIYVRYFLAVARRFWSVPKLFGVHAIPLYHPRLFSITSCTRLHITHACSRSPPALASISPTPVLDHLLNPPSHRTHHYQSHTTANRIPLPITYHCQSCTVPTTANHVPLPIAYHCIIVPYPPLPISCYHLSILSIIYQSAATTSASYP